MGNVAACMVNVDKKEPFSNDLTVYYWPMLGRGGATMRILDYAGVPYTHKSEFGEIAGVGGAFGAQSTTFAPPILVDGDFTISQSTAVAFYVGKKCGLTEGMDDSKAIQILADLIDTFEGGIGTAAEKGGAALKEFLEGKGDGPSRFAKLMGNLERNIQGPYFFGASLTVCDFMLCALVDWQDGTKMQRLTKETGFDPWAGFPKAAAVVAAVRGLSSYKANSTPIVRDGFHAKDELFTQYKAASVL